MGKMEIVTEIQSPHRTIEKQRISSDNYRVYLYLEKWDDNGIVSYSDVPLLTLTNTSLTKFSIKANDEFKKKKPCTRKEQVGILFHKGFDMDLQFAKVTDDISSMMFQQYIWYHGNAKSLGKDVRTPEDGKSDGLGVSVFGSKDLNYLTPTYMMKVGIRHFEGIEEFIDFQSVQFFNFTQSAEEGSTDIVETVQAFSPYCHYITQNSQNVFDSAGKTSRAGFLVSKSAKKYILNKP